MQLRHCGLRYAGTSEEPHAAGPVGKTRNTRCSNIVAKLTPTKQRRQSSPMPPLLKLDTFDNTAMVHSTESQQIAQGLKQSTISVLRGRTHLARMHCPEEAISPRNNTICSDIYTIVPVLQAMVAELNVFYCFPCTTTAGNRWAPQHTMGIFPPTCSTTTVVFASLAILLSIARVGVKQKCKAPKLQLGVA